MSQTVKGIAESINTGIRSGTAMKSREPGPARKDGNDLMPWVVETVEAVVETPLCLDTTYTDAMIAGFKAVKNKEAAIMNSISAQPERVEALIPVAAETGCNVMTF